MSEPTGWGQDRARPPHLFLTAGLGTLRPEVIQPTTVNGRELLVLAGTDDESLPVRFVELDSGTLLPDRSLLHSAELAALGAATAERTLLATVTRNGTVAVRDAHTGVPAGPAIHGPRDPLAAVVFVAGGRELVAVSGPDQCRVWHVPDGSQVAAQDFGGTALVVHEERVLALSGTQLRDVLTGQAYGEPLPAADNAILAAVVHHGRVLVVSAAATVRAGDAATVRAWDAATVRAWDALTGAVVPLPPLWPAARSEPARDQQPPPGSKRSEPAPDQAPWPESDRSKPAPDHPPRPGSDRSKPDSLHRLMLAGAEDGLAAVVTWRTAGGDDRTELWLPGGDGPHRSPLPGADGPHRSPLPLEAAGRTCAAAGDAAGTVRIWEIEPRL